MDVPTVELFETAVTFEAKHSDPLSAHQSLSKTFGKKAGVSFRVPRRYCERRPLLGLLSRPLA